MKVTHSISQAKTSVELALKAGLVPYLIGSPGVSKSSIVKQIADEYNLAFIDIRLSQQTPEDLNGFPKVDGDVATYIPFDTFPTTNTPLPKGKDGWLILKDELPSANRSVLAAVYKIILDREVGQHKLHDKVKIVCAGNLSTDNAIVNPIGTAMQSRLITIEVQPTFEDFLKYAYANNYDSRIIGYLNWRKEHMINFDPFHQEYTFPTLRTWEFTNKLMNTLTSEGIAIDTKSVGIIAGAIGQSVAFEFLTFCEIFKDLPKIEEIMKKPDTTHIPSEISTRYAMITYLADSITKDNCDSVCTYVGRFTRELHVLFARMVNERDRTFSHIDSFKQLAINAVKAL